MTTIWRRINRRRVGVFVKGHKSPHRTFIGRAYGLGCLHFDVIPENAIANNA
jgi:hypothetical protein